MHQFFHEASFLLGVFEKGCFPVPCDKSCNLANLMRKAAKANKYTQTFAQFLL